jgi:NADH-quinone oxidoreductase subunit N
MMLLAQSNHFVMLFVALETVTIGFYILVSYFRDSPLSLEAGLKYLIMGALSSAILLFGIVLLYGVAGNRRCRRHRHTMLRRPPRISSRPIPTTSSPAPASCSCSPASRSRSARSVPDLDPRRLPGRAHAGDGVPRRGVEGRGFRRAADAGADGLRALRVALVPVLSLMAAATIIFGNLAALTQHNVKRLMGLSGVSHAGYLLLGVIAAARVPLGAGRGLFLPLRLPAGLVRGVRRDGARGRPGRRRPGTRALRNLPGSRPFLAAVLAVGLGSLAGIPPLAGFMGKLLHLHRRLPGRPLRLLAWPSSAW